MARPAKSLSPGTLEEEVSQWSDWSFTFKNFLTFLDANDLDELTSAETETTPIDDVWYGGNDDRKRRGIKLYPVLSSYLKS